MTISGIRALLAEHGIDSRVTADVVEWLIRRKEPTLITTEFACVMKKLFGHNLLIAWEWVNIQSPVPSFAIVKTYDKRRN